MNILTEGTVAATIVTATSTAVTASIVSSRCSGRRSSCNDNRRASSALVRFLSRQGHLVGVVLLAFIAIELRPNACTRAFSAYGTSTRHVAAYFRSVPAHTASASSSTTSAKTTISLEGYLDQERFSGNLDDGLCSILVAVANSCAMISQRLKTHALDGGNGNTVLAAETTVNVQGEQQAGMDVVANGIFLEALGSIPCVAAMASEEEEAVIYGSSAEENSPNETSGNAQPSYEIAFDPLDGSGNLDVNLPTGSIFGISPAAAPDKAFSRQGSELVAAGYALYSASTELVIAMNGKVAGFTLVNDNDFVLSRPDIRCPPQGPYYSLNDAREPDWPDGLKRWMHDAKKGQTSTQTMYSSRYVCSLCADFHRTLLKGGWAGNPRPHLRLLYEAAPLAFVAQTAGGRGTDGTGNLLDIVPEGLHDRVCVFLGSQADIDDLESYGDVQQVEFKRYMA